MSSDYGSGWFEIADPVVKAIIRKKLRVSLFEQDDRRSNQDALDLVQNVHQDLAEAVVTGAGGIQDLKSYAAVVAYHACAQYLRNRFPAHTRLKNKIRYVLNHEPGFAVWETRDGELCYGYAGWQANPLAEAESVNAFIAAPARIWGDAKESAKKTGQVKALETMKAADWRSLIEEILDKVLALP